MSHTTVTEKTLEVTEVSNLEELEIMRMFPLLLLESLK